MSGKGSKRNHYTRHRNDKPKTIGDRGREVLKEIDENNPVVKAFRQYAVELDDKHDRYERVVKISRDITIESKRIIFLLHNIDKENKRESILEEANTRLQSLITNHFQNIAKELEKKDIFQYLKAYTCGLQEFVEATTFYQYLKNNSIEHWSNLERQLTYNTEIASSEAQEDVIKKKLKTPVPALEYLLGMADLTGELMRKCINNLGSGNIDDCFQTCNFVRDLYKGFLIVGNVPGCKDLSKKVYVLRQSLHKMEMVCYNITVRGSEIPKHMLATVVLSNNNEVSNDDEDEGFF